MGLADAMIGRYASTLLCKIDWSPTPMKSKVKNGQILSMAPIFLFYFLALCLSGMIMAIEVWGKNFLAWKEGVVTHFRRLRQEGVFVRSL